METFLFQFNFVGIWINIYFAPWSPCCHRHTELHKDPPCFYTTSYSTCISCMSLYFFITVLHMIFRAASAVCVWADRDSGGSGDGHSPLQRRADPGSRPARWTGLWKGGKMNKLLTAFRELWSHHQPGDSAVMHGCGEAFKCKKLNLNTTIWTSVLWWEQTAALKAICRPNRGQWIVSSFIPAMSFSSQSQFIFSSGKKRLL